MLVGFTCKEDRAGFVHRFAGSNDEMDHHSVVRYFVLRICYFELLIRSGTYMIVILYRVHLPVFRMVEYWLGEQNLNKIVSATIVWLKPATVHACWKFARY